MSVDLVLNWKICVLIFSFVTAILITNTKLVILPVSGVTFIISSLTVWFLSFWMTLIGLHKLLSKNKPIEYDLSKSKARSKGEVGKKQTHFKADPEAVRKLGEDIDKNFITKWFVNISIDGDFTRESRQVLEEAINRLVEVQMCVDNKKLVQGFLNIYLKHLKEFRRTLKRKEKYSAEIVELYSYSHASSGSVKARDYFLHQLTINVLSQFINWELWNSLPCHIVISILARKFTSYMLNLVSTPGFINYFILNLVASNAIKSQLDLDNYSTVLLSEYIDLIEYSNAQQKTDVEIMSKKPDIVKSVVLKDSVLKHMVASRPQSRKPSAASLFEESVSKRIESDHSTQSVEKAREKEVKDLDIPPTKNVVKSDPVKIYEPKSSSKRWSYSQDLELGVSLGHDPLNMALLITPEIEKSASNDKVEDSYGEFTSNASNLLNEVRHITSMEGIKSSIKPISDATVHTLHNIKDLQEATVNNALNKIGDFQDEAAGVVEGLLDFGRAGLRKGLRLTGLHDNIENAKATFSSTHSTNKPAKRKFAKLTRSDSIEKTSSADSMESVWINPIQIDSPNYDGHILLEKSKKSDDTDSQTSRGDGEIPLIPFIMMDLENEHDSPDPEYEETADLASTIAKLRSLLQQKSSESNLSTPAVSPLPPDEFPLKIDPENVSDVDEVDGMMPSFYKFCAKTATGVIHNTLNTIKTALPGHSPEAGFPCSAEEWNFVLDNEGSDFLNKMTKLLNERQAFCTVETAYEAIDSLHEPNEAILFPQLQFDDELDDFEVKIPLTKALMDIICELLADTNSPLLKEPVVRAILLSFGCTVEKSIIAQTDKLMDKFCTNLFRVPENSTDKTLYLDLNTYVDALLASFPDYMKHIFGSGVLKKALTVLSSSLQFKRINEDIFLQILELICLKLIEESTKVSPPASA